MRAQRLNHVVLRSPDVERQVAYCEGVIGLRVRERHGGRVYLCTRSGADAIVLSDGTETALEGVAFRVGTEAQETLAGLQRHGLRGELRTDPHQGIAESVILKDPNGLDIELFDADPLHAPAPASGVGPMRLGHVAVVSTDVLETCRFYGEVLGFSVGDWVEDFFVFMRCGHEHHTVNFIAGSRRRMHHVAFEMQNSAALVASCDVLAGAGLEIIWGPVRHGPGHNIATYHRSPEGQIVELYTEMDIMTNEALGYYDPRPWHADRPQRPKVWSTKGPRRDVWGPFPPADFLNQGV